jgi:hypothetical protein
MWSIWFDGLGLARGNDGTTIIHGAVIEQGALHGLLRRERGLGLPLSQSSRVQEERWRWPMANPDT